MNMDAEARELVERCANGLRHRIVELKKELAFEEEMLAGLQRLLGHSAQSPEAPPVDDFDLQVNAPVEKMALRLAAKNPNARLSWIAEEVRAAIPGSRTSATGVGWYLAQARKDPKKRKLLPPERL